MQAQGAGGQLGMVVELLARSGTGPFALAPVWKKKKNPHVKRGQVEEENANRFAITTFSSC